MKVLESSEIIACDPFTGFARTNWLMWRNVRGYSGHCKRSLPWRHRQRVADMTEYLSVLGAEEFDLAFLGNWIQGVCYSAFRAGIAEDNRGSCVNVWMQTKV